MKQRVEVFLPGPSQAMASLVTGIPREQRYHALPMGHFVNARQVDQVVHGRPRVAGEWNSVETTVRCNAAEGRIQ
jgi:hypothetical protein